MLATKIAATLPLQGWVSSAIQKELPWDGDDDSCVWSLAAGFSTSCPTVNPQPAHADLPLAPVIGQNASVLYNSTGGRARLRRRETWMAW
ncbi:uncharacterized protein B0H18DRAFT_1124263 [Fomitopsis serialis]|uniref:uncharacterized protein n=1 Tax=Fomitopsis serialis TaxID=139415 RepID=UPI002007EB2F|nr:uncharacterized protein B0H18DRAFT_1124263 [Neoantrodia serialis]KAH9916358.1 hypothetical protein B0H18DRAFT_1124263 [Neoantrodia serialis]